MNEAKQLRISQLPFLSVAVLASEDVRLAAQAYKAKRHRKQPIKNFARFEDWSGLVRSALVWLGEADPLLGREQLEDGDPIRVKLRSLLLAWFAVFKTAPATSKEAINRANETKLDDQGTEQPAYPAMKEALEEHFSDRKGGISSNGIGYFLRQHAGRILMGARFERAGTVQHREQWRVVVVDKARFETELGKNTRPAAESSPSSPSSPPPPNHHRRQNDAATENQRDTPRYTRQAPREDGCHGEDGEDGEDVPLGSVKFSFAETLTGDAADLWAILKHYRGWETFARLARKMGWPQLRVITAAQELQGRGRATIDGDSAMPVWENAPCGKREANV